MAHLHQPLDQIATFNKPIPDKSGTKKHKHKPPQDKEPPEIEDNTRRDTE